MSLFLSAEARSELQEHYEAQKNLAIDAVVNEAISSELDLAIETLQTVEAIPEISPPSLMELDQPSTSRKRMAVSANATDDDFRNPPGGKNMVLARKNFRTPSVRSLSPTPSTCSNSSTAADDDTWMAAINEEKQRRAEFRQRADAGNRDLRKKMKKSHDRISRIRWERKSLRENRERLREQIRTLDQRELSLDKSERSEMESLKKYEVIAAKFDEIMN